ncbi:MAG: septum formation initiator family protein [Cyclobacteriaceae bacterium]|nr:septum formation initiator family protein [Cyclobacteriaceae bacterium]
MKWPRIFRNFYFLTGIFFIVWMFLIDSNDWISQVRLSTKLSELEKQKEYYQENIIQIKQQYEERNNDPRLLEKYAREKYLMKKDNEDIYIIVEEE